MLSIKTSDVLRIFLGLVLIILNLVSLVILASCRKLGFQVRILSLHLVVTDLGFGLLTFLKGLHLHLVSVITCRVMYHCHMTFSIMTCLVITTFSGDRFFALRFPLLYQRVITANRITAFALCSWILSALFSILSLIRMEPFVHKTCNYVAELIGQVGFRIYGALWIMIILLNVGFYIGICYFLLAHRRRIHTTESQVSRKHQTDDVRILIKILAITMTFVLCYTPNMIMAVLIAYDYNNRKVYFTAYFYSVVLKMSNSVLNPFLYFLRFKECRYRFLMMLYFWNPGKQERIEEEYRKETASYNLESTNGRNNLE